MNPYYQGYLDGMCGIYSIVNADKAVNNSSYIESQTLFNRLIEFLNEEGILRDIIIDGTNQQVMRTLMSQVANDHFPLQISNKRGIIKLKDWWDFSRSFLEEKPNRAIILSLGGRISHLTVTYRMTERSAYLMDSGTGGLLRRSNCAMQGYTDTDKYIIYPSQCWYLGKE